QLGVQPPVVPFHVQLVVPFELVHAAPHVLQLLTVVSGTRQPELGLPPHTPCVESHDGTQPPVEPLYVHALVPPTCWHTVPHAPQFDVVVSDVRQPVLGLPPHSACVESHVGTQPPVVPLNVQVVVPCGLAQVVPHAPQCAVVLSATRQPALGLPPHTPCVESHVGTQPPDVPLNVHVVVPFGLAQV